MTDAAPSTPPPPVPPGGTRSPHGSFPVGQEAAVIERLVRDLKVAGGQDILASYRKSVSDDKRRERAQGVLAAALEESLNPDDLGQLVEILYFAGYQRLLAKHQLLFPAYNILDEYFVNANGPWGPLTPRRPRVLERSWTLLGKKIGFPIGVPASVLTDNAQWIHYFARNGFNVLTYRTLRSRFHIPNAPPNWVFVPQVTSPLEILPDYERHTVHADPDDWVDAGRRDVSTANSFGVPCIQPSMWEADLEEALNVIHDDQILLVSVMGEDYEDTQDPQVLIDDWIDVVLRAERVGADAIELNLSCPNSLSASKDEVKPPLCRDARLTELVVNAVRDVLKPSTKLVAKLSHLDANALGDLVGQIGPLVDAMAGMNTLPCLVHRRTEGWTFPGREVAGVSGIAIREHAIEFVRTLAKLRLETGARFEIIGMGGVTDVQSFEALYNAGATAVQSASGSFANPFLAWECVEALGKSLPVTPEIQDDLRHELESALLAVTPADVAIDQYALAAAMPVPPSQTFAVLRSLVASGQLIATGKQGRAYRRPAPAS